MTSSEFRQGRVIDEQASTPRQLQQGVEINTSDSFELANVAQANDPITDDFGEALVAPKKGSWLKRLFVFGVLTLVTVEAAITVYTSFLMSPALGALYAGVIAAGTALIGKTAFREYRLLKRLRENQINQASAERLLHSEQIGEAKIWLENLAKLQPKQDFTPVMQAISAHHTDKEIMTLYRDTVLVEQDKQAAEIIRKYAVTTGVMVSISPVAIVDMAAVLWRGCKMIEELAAHYGMPLGYVSRVRLYKLIIKHMLFAGTAELVSDFATTALSAELTAKLSARAAQGVSVAIITTRLGYKAMETCRPLPVLENKSSLLGNSVKSLINALGMKSSKE